MTVCGSFDLEDDDFFDDTFRNIYDSEFSNLHSANILSGSISTSHDEDHPSTEIKLQNSLPTKTSLPIVNTNLNSEGTNSSLDLYKNKQSSENLKSDESNAGKTPFHSPKINSDVSFEKTTVINSRFTPGFTPKVKKRKFPGPAGVFSEQNNDNFHCEESNHLAKKKIEAEIEVQDITNSQFSAEDLLLPSWQNLQADVSSKRLLSSAKYYSIRRVFYETSKKKPPKHIVVPVLCVLLKDFNQAEHSVFIDDTGEIKGKIDKQVLTSFEKYLKNGVALILKKVTFLCNVLLLTQQSIVSIYLDDGTVKQIQEVDSVPCREEPLKPMNCLCTETVTVKAARNETTLKGCTFPVTPESCIHGAVKTVAEIHLAPKMSLVQKNYHSLNTSSSAISSKEKFPTSGSGASTSIPSSKCLNFSSASVSHDYKGTSDMYVVPKSPSLTSTNLVINSSQAMPCISTARHVSKLSDYKNEQGDSIKIAEMSIDASVLFGGNSDFDEFDELLGNLDEKSFLEEF